MTLEGPVDGSLDAGSVSLAQAPDLRPLSLRGNFAWTLVGTGVYGASQWGMLIVLAKLGSADIVGRFALGLALCAPVVMFANMQLRIVQATDARAEYSFGQYLSLRLITSAMALAIIAGTVALAGYGAEAGLVILAVGVAKCVESISDIIYGLWQRNERLDLIAVSQMVKGSASLGALWLVMRVTGDLLWGVAALGVTWLSVLLSYDVVNARRMLRAQARRSGKAAPTRPRLRELPRLAWLALPLGAVGLLDSLNVNIPRYSLEHAVGEAALGHFAALAYLIVAGNMVVMALAQSAAPRLARHYGDDLGAFTHLVWQLVKFGTGLGAVGLAVAIALGPQVLTILYRPEYAAHAEVLAWLMAAAAVGYVARFLVCSMTAARYLKAQAPVYAGGTLVCATTSSWLIPRYGLYGAAWATGATMLVLLLGAIATNLHAVRSRARREETTAAAMTVSEGL